MIMVHVKCHAQWGNMKLIQYVNNVTEYAKLVLVQLLINVRVVLIYFFIIQENACETVRQGTFTWNPLIPAKNVIIYVK